MEESIEFCKNELDKWYADSNNIDKGNELNHMFHNILKILSSNALYHILINQIYI